MGRSAHFCEKCLCKAGEGAGSAGLRAALVARGASGTQLSTWLFNWCINNNIEDLRMQTAQLWFVSPTEPIPTNPPLPRCLFQRWQGPKPSLAKKVWNWQEPLSNPFSTAEFPYPPGKCLMCCERFIGSFPGATHSQLLPIPAGSCPGEMSLETQENPHKLSVQPQQQCPVQLKQRKVNFYVSRMGKYQKIAMKSFFLLLFFCFP